MPDLTKGLTVWFTGLPSAGKTTIAHALEKRLLEEDDVKVEILDGDVARTHLTKGLGFSKEDRDENIRRIGYVAQLLTRNGVVTLCSVISPYKEIREEIRGKHGSGQFFEVYVSTPTDVCRERDVKGLYAKHAAGEIKSLTGVDDPYEPPLAPDVTIAAHDLTLDESVELVWQALS